MGRRIQRYAWFNSGYKFMRQTTAGFAGSVLFFPLVRPMMRCIMAGMYGSRVQLCRCCLVGNCGDSAVAVHRRSLIVLSCCSLVGKP